MKLLSPLFSVHLIAAALLLLSFSTRVCSADDEAKFAKWEKEIAAFEAADQKQPQPKGGIVFVGSSSIRLWDVKKSFPGLPVINRGFGGSQIEDSTHFAERIVFPYEPCAVVFYAGDNDIAVGKSAETVAADFKAFAKKVNERLPNTPLLFIAIKPSPSRWKLFETQIKANKLIREYCEECCPAPKFVDIVKPMLGAEGQPREELFVKDRLHMNADGYALWNGTLRPHLEKIVTGTPRLNTVLTAKRVVFLGDSITNAGHYIAYFEACLATRFPKQRFEFLNLGLPSETCSGLSEDGHAGGKFPRPDLHERLQRVLDKAKPDLIIACYGMNCGIYLPFDEQRFAKYQDGICRLRTAAHTAGAQVIHLTPPTYDPTRGGGSPDYNEVLDRYSEWLLSQRADGWMVIDIHGAMNRHLAERRRWNPKFVLAGDGVHAGPTGHWLMADVLVDHFGGPIPFGTGGGIEINTENPSDDLNKPEVGDIDYEGIIPSPVDPAWERDSLALSPDSGLLGSFYVGAKPLKAPRYDVFEGDKLVGTLTAHELQSDSEADLRLLESLSINVRSGTLLKKISTRQRLLSDAWLNEIGHLRPGMAKGEPLDKAIAEAAKLSDEIAALAQPTKVTMTFKPNPEPFPGKKSD